MVGQVPIFQSSSQHAIIQSQSMKTGPSLLLISSPSLKTLQMELQIWLSSTNQGTQGKPLECMPPICVPHPSKMQVNLRICKGKILTSVELIPAFVSPFYVEIYVLVKWSLINSGRMPESFGYRFGAVILSAAMLCTFFWQQEWT